MLYLVYDDGDDDDKERSAHVACCTRLHTNNQSENFTNEKKSANRLRCQ